MFTTLKRMLKLGVEIASITKREAEKEVKRLVKSGKISPKEGKALVRKMLELAELQRKYLGKIGKEGVAAAKRVYKKIKPIAERKGKVFAKKIYRKAKKRIPKRIKRKIRKVRRR